MRIEDLRLGNEDVPCEEVIDLIIDMPVKSCYIVITT